MQRKCTSQTEGMSVFIISIRNSSGSTGGWCKETLLVRLMECQYFVFLLEIPRDIYIDCWCNEHFGQNEGMFIFLIPVREYLRICRLLIQRQFIGQTERSSVFLFLLKQIYSVDISVSTEFACKRSLTWSAQGVLWFLSALVVSWYFHQAVRCACWFEY